MPIAAKVAAAALAIAVFCSFYFGPALFAQTGTFAETKTEIPSTTAKSPANASSPVAQKKTTKPKAKSLPSPTVNVDVTEWVVFVADVSNPMLNGKELFHTDLPDFTDDSRRSGNSSGEQTSGQPTTDAPAVNAPYSAAAPAADASGGATSADDAKLSGPSPIGLIRLSADGPVNKHAKIDVQLSFTGGRTLGYWPRGKTRWAGLLWEDLGLDTAATEERKLPEGSWLAALRGGSLPLVDDKTRESFLLYDVELRYPVRIVVSGHEHGKYTFSHTMSAPLHDLTFYKRDAAHWQTATIADVKGEPAQAKLAEAKASAAPTPTASNAANQPVRIVATVNGVVTTVVTQNAPSTSKADTSSSPAAVAAGKAIDFSLGPATETDSTVLAPWRGRLAAAGVSTADQDAVLKILARYGLDSKRLTAIYRLDPAELDRILALEVVPQPKKISRIGLVIVRGLDPVLNAELDQLIKQLGDPSWKKRDAATKAIRKFGIRAKPRLAIAVNDKDTEIAYRAEELLASLANESH